MLHIVVGEDSILIYKSFEIIRRLFFFVRHGRERAITTHKTMKRAELGLLEVLGLLVRMPGVKVMSRLSPCFAGEQGILLSSLFPKNPLDFAIFS